MRRKEAVVKELETIEGKLAALRGIVNTSQPIKEYLRVIKETEERLDQVKLYIEAER